MLRIVQGLADVLPKQLRRLKLQYEQVLKGITSEIPDWNRCTTFVNLRMPLSVAKLYVNKHFTDNSKDIVLEMIDEIKKAMRGRINSATWMDDTTKQRAYVKVDFIESLIGYPDKVLNDTFLSKKYEEVDFENDALLHNEIMFRKHVFKEMISLYGKKVDKTKWELPPAYVNAYYQPMKNQIVFPAGILQPPLFDRLYPDYINFAGIGQIIGHEITHGFDQAGSTFDEYGNLGQWWTSLSRTGFLGTLKCMVDQYSNYTVPEIGLKLNGNLTLGENIADNGGLKISFEAYKSSLKKKTTEFRLPGVALSFDQIFFVKFAQVWCGSYRPKEALKRLYGDNHSTFKFRVNGPLQNSEQFAKTFNCKAGSAMYKSKSCKVW